jgi:hypothetical protein
MVDKEACRDLHSNLFHQRGVMSSASECSCCIDLNNKLKCALDEVSSLNLIIQLLQNKVTLNCALASSVTNSSMDKQEDHEVNTHRNWIVINSKVHSNLYRFKKWNNLPVNQHILTSNPPPRINNGSKRVDSIQ